MTAFGPKLERHALAFVLLAAGVCCLVISSSTSRLEVVNDMRRAQLDLLRELAADPVHLPPGPIAELDGLFGRRVELVESPQGLLLAFARQASPAGASH